MTTSLLEADSLLAIDVGEINTRAVLFDVVDGRYRFLGIGIAPTTAGHPFRDVGEGVRHALDQLQEITGRKLVGEDERLIIPSLANGSGVDTFVTTLSAGPPLKVVAVGLLEDISLESACNLATTTYAQVIETLSLNDRRKPAARVDAILRARPDLIIVAGGTDGGASRSLLQLVESVGLGCKLSSQGHRPEVLFAGNQSLTEKVESSLKLCANVHIAANVRPLLEVEQLDPAQKQIAEIFRSIRCRQIGGAQELDNWSSGQLFPTSTAFGRIIRFLSRVYNPAKGVLGIDVGASATTIAASFAGDLTLGVYPQLGLGKGLPGLLEHCQLGDIARWLPLEIGENYLLDYIYNKMVFPASLPVTAEDLAIEQALARQVMQIAIGLAARGFPKNAGRPEMAFLPWFEPIVATGSVLTRAPSRGQIMLMLLDALQPAGVTTIVLDQNNLSASLGASASVNPDLTVQVLESGNFLNLGTVVAPVAHVRPGTPVLRLRITRESGDEMSMDVKQGSLEALALPLGQSAQLHLQPLHRADIGMGGPGRAGKLRVMGGTLGLVIDARGRPLRLPESSGRRRELLKKWLWTLGG